MSKLPNMNPGAMAKDMKTNEGTEAKASSAAGSEAKQSEARAARNEGKASRAHGPHLPETPSSLLPCTFTLPPRTHGPQAIPRTQATNEGDFGGTLRCSRYPYIDPSAPNLSGAEIIGEQRGEADSTRTSTTVRENATSEKGAGSNVSNTFPLRHFSQVTCDASTRKALFDYYPSASEDEVLRRYLVYALWTPWIDDEKKLPLIPWQSLEWMWGKRYRRDGTVNTSGKTVLEHIQEKLPEFAWTHWHYSSTGEERSHCRMIRWDGIDPSLKQLVREDLLQPQRVDWI